MLFFVQNNQTNYICSSYKSGSGYFDLRDANDDWVRIPVSKGDWFEWPAGINHRFTVDENAYIQAMRLYKGSADPEWTAVPRSDILLGDNTVRNEYINTYLCGVDPDAAINDEIEDKVVDVDILIEKEDEGEVLPKESNITWSLESPDIWTEDESSIIDNDVDVNNVTWGVDKIEEEAATFAGEFINNNIGVSSADGDEDMMFSNERLDDENNSAAISGTSLAFFSMVFAGAVSWMVSFIFSRV